MKFNRFSSSLLAVPVALLAFAAVPKDAQAGHYVSSPYYAAPHYTYAPTPQAYYYSSSPQVYYYSSSPSYYAPPVVYQRPHRSRSFGISFGGSYRSYGHHGRSSHHGHRSHWNHH